MFNFESYLMGSTLEVQVEGKNLEDAWANHEMLSNYYYHLTDVAQSRYLRLRDLTEYAASIYVYTEATTEVFFNFAEEWDFARERYLVR